MMQCIPSIPAGTCVQCWKKKCVTASILAVVFDSYTCKQQIFGQMRCTWKIHFLREESGSLFDHALSWSFGWDQPSCLLFLSFNYLFHSYSFQQTYKFDTEVSNEITHSGGVLLKGDRFGLSELVMLGWAAEPVIQFFWLWVKLWLNWLMIRLEVKDCDLGHQKPPATYWTSTYLGIIGSKLFWNKASNVRRLIDSSSDPAK